MNDAVPQGNAMAAEGQRDVAFEGKDKGGGDPHAPREDPRVSADAMHMRRKAAGGPLLAGDSIKPR